MRTGGALATESVRRLRQSLATMLVAPDPSEALSEVAAALSGLLGCDVIVLTAADGSTLRVDAVAGRHDGRHLCGRAFSTASWRRMLEESERWGGLRFCRDPRPYLRLPHLDVLDDSLMALGDDEHWGALNLLLAPMWSTDGELVGSVALNAAAGDPLPDELMRTVLELFTAQAGLALYQSRLAARAADDHRALRQSEERFRLAFDNAPIGIAEVTAREDALVVSRVNRAAGRMLRLSPAEARGRRVDDVFGARDGESLEHRLAGLWGEDRDALTIEARLGPPDGPERWVMVCAAVLPDVAGRANLLCHLVDITDARADNLALEQRAHHDALTGLPNRLVVLERLTAVVQAAEDSGLTGALMFCDLDSFKAINDERGHLVGDDVLARLADRLGGAIRGQDLAGRFGGDEFVVVSYPISSGAAKKLGDRIAETLSEPIRVDDEVLSVQVSIGIAMISGDADPKEVLRRADSAMYAARSRRHRPSFVIDSA